jgi:hypothetical protein
LRGRRSRGEVPIVKHFLCQRIIKSRGRPAMLVRNEAQASDTTRRASLAISCAIFETDHGKDPRVAGLPTTTACSAAFVRPLVPDRRRPIPRGVLIGIGVDAFDGRRMAFESVALWSLGATRSAIPSSSSVARSPAPRMTRSLAPARWLGLLPA